MLNKGESLERKRFFFDFQKVDSAALWPLLNSTFSGTDTQSGFDEELRFYKYHNFQRFCYVDATENFWHFHSRFLPILNWVIFLILDHFSDIFVRNRSGAVLSETPIKFQKENWKKCNNIWLQICWRKMWPSWTQKYSILNNFNKLKSEFYLSSFVSYIVLRLKKQVLHLRSPIWRLEVSLADHHLIVNIFEFMDLRPNSHWNTVTVTFELFCCCWNSKYSSLIKVCNTTFTQNLLS